MTGPGHNEAGGGLEGQEVSYWAWLPLEEPQPRRTAPGSALG